MDETLSLILSGNSSVLTSRYFPPIELSPHKNYVLGLVEFLTYHSIPNIDKGKNKFYVGDIIITIPVGAYDIIDIETFLLKELTPKGITLSLKPNNNTLRCVVKSSESIDFTKPDSIGPWIGFSSRVLEKTLNTNLIYLLMYSKFNLSE